jgi:hypothetical protein
MVVVGLKVDRGLEGEAGVRLSYNIKVPIRQRRSRRIGRR